MTNNILKIDKQVILIIMTLLVASILNILPTPIWVKYYWPDWILLTIIYWCLASPQSVSIKFAWIIGIFADLLYSSLIGHHALLYTITAYLACSFHHLIRLYPPHQQILPIMGILLICEIISLWINGLRYAFTPADLMGLLSIFTSGVIWPWVFSILRYLRQKFYPIAQG